MTRKPNRIPDTVRILATQIRYHLDCGARIEDIADAAMVSPQTIRNYLHMKSRAPNLLKVADVGSVVGLTLNWKRK